jgi:hypothetical protein
MVTGLIETEDEIFEFGRDDGRRFEGQEVSAAADLAPT